MIRNETYDYEGLVSAEVIDIDAGTLTVEDGAGNVLHPARPLTDEEVARYTVQVVPDPEPDPAVERPLLLRAEEAAQAAYDQIISAGTLSMSRINQANQAASAARLAVLAQGEL